MFGEHFWGCIARTATGGGELLVWLIVVAESKIDEFDGVVFGDHDVFGFDISVGDSEGVQILDCVE